MSDYNPCDPCKPCSENQECDVPDYDTTGCLYPQGSECISYDTDVPCLGFTKGKLSTLLQKLITYTLTMFSRVVSNSLKVTREGTCQDTLRIELEPSLDLDNILVLGSDGLPYVPKTDVVIHDSQCITWSKVLIDNVIHYTPTLDIACIATQVCTICADEIEACDPPQNLDVEAVLHNHGIAPSITTDVLATITWTEIPGVTYNLYLDNVLIQAGASSGHQIDGLDPDTTYTVKVVASCPQGGSGESQITFETPLEEACGAPTDLTVT